MGYRFRKGRGQFTAPTSRSGKSYTYSGRRVLLSGDNFQLTINGPGFEAFILQSLTEAFQYVSDSALDYMQSIVPVDTGALRDSCYITFSVENGRIRIEIGATQRYAVYVELGTSSHSAQPYIRPTYDFIAKILPQVIRDEVARRGR